MKAKKRGRPFGSKNKKKETQNLGEAIERAHLDDIVTAQSALEVMSMDGLDPESVITVALAALRKIAFGAK